jgi:hypothetical protein
MRMQAHNPESRWPQGRPAIRKRLGLGLSLLALCSASVAMGLRVEPSVAACGAPVAAPAVPPHAALHRLADSQAVRGQKDLQWVWLGSPTSRYPHTALGSPVHAGSLHALVAGPTGAVREVVYLLPLHRVFEDRVPRLADLDGDGRDEIIVVESDAIRGAALVVLGLRAHAPTDAARDQPSAPVLIERARSPYTGAPFRWLNPVGVADFDGDGRLDIASVTTPHIGGVLTLHRFRPPVLEPYAKAMDVSNHRMGALEQSLAAIVEAPGHRPTVIVPDMQLRALHALRWEAPGQWRELADPKPLQARVERLSAAPGGACALLADGSWWRMMLSP